MSTGIGKVTRKDYLECFRSILTEMEEDFPKKFVAGALLRHWEGAPVNSDLMSRWACVEAGMYEFTGEKAYLRRARELILLTIEGIEKTPKILWGYLDSIDPVSLKLMLEMHRKFPGSVINLGSFGWVRALGLPVHLLEKFGGWESKAERERVKKVVGEVADFRLEGLDVESYPDNERPNNRNLASTEGVYRIALAFPDHPHARRWHQWAEKQFLVSLNQACEEDASGYQACWFHSLLIMIELTGKGEECYFLPYHKAYFEHLRDLIIPGGAYAEYGDQRVGVANSAHLSILEKAASVFKDGSYKYAASSYFRATVREEPQEVIHYLVTGRWLDAYRWADDAIEPTFPELKSTITGEGKVILRIGNEKKNSYLSLTSKDLKKNHGQVDANAISKLVHKGSTLLEDGGYHWREAFYHNRLLWREGKPPGKIMDYFRCQELDWWVNSKRKLFSATHGNPQGVEKGWHPSSEEDIKIQFLVQFPQFSATRSSLGPQERTIILDQQGSCLVFDYLDIDQPLSSVCLYYTCKVLERGEYWVKGEASEGKDRAFPGQFILQTKGGNWVRGKASKESRDFHPLFVFLEPRKVNLEPQLRSRTTQQILYSFSDQAHPWFVSLILASGRGTHPQSLLENYRLSPILNEEKHPIAQVLSWEEEGRKVLCACRKKEYAQSILYPKKIKTDAELIYLEEKKEEIKVILVNASLLEYQGRTLVKSRTKESFSKVLEKN